MRKYLTHDERISFLRHADTLHNDDVLFCRILLETGCRISEATAIRWKNIDFSAKNIYFETLKQRRRGVFRRVPISADTVNLFSIEYAKRIAVGADVANELIWNFCRMTAYRHVRSAMHAVGISGLHACPKGLRHGFAIAALEAGVPMNLVQRWLGHARLETTTIYANFVGVEERAFASRLWADHGSAGPPPVA